MNKLLILYLLTFILFCFFTYLFIDPNFIYLTDFYTGFANKNRFVVSILYFGFMVGLFGLYAKILQAKNLTNYTNLKNYKFLLLIPLLGILSYPAVLSFDIFNYVATAKVSFFYFENPYVVMPIEFVGDPILLFTRAANKIALYGPGWIGFTSLPFYLSFGNYLLSLILFKVLVSIFFLATIGMIWKMTKNVYSVLYFAASPLVLIETFVSGHNDIVMMFFALGSIFFLKNKKVLLGLGFLLLSISIKYATIFLLPVFGYVFYKRWRRRELDWDFVYLLSFIMTLIIFSLSPIREEIYPWYVIWPLTFLSLIVQRYKLLATFFIFFTFCLMLRYISYMLTGDYFGITPFIKLFITFVLPLTFGIYLLHKHKFKIS